MSPQVRISIALAIVFGIYAGSTSLTAELIESVYRFGCDQEYFSVRCAFPEDSAEQGLAYPVLALFLLVFAAAALTFWRRAAAYPFLILSVGLCAGALLWDMMALRPVILAPKIINDTINILRTVIAASFVLLIVLCRTQQFSLWRLTVAVVTSFSLTAASVVAFIELSGTVFGVTELFLLYVIYAFGSFTVHLMTVCGFVARLPHKAEERAFA